MSDCIEILPEHIKAKICKLGSVAITEIRLRTGKPMFVKSYSKEISTEYIVKQQDMVEILKRISNNSIYSIQNCINNGYIMAPGGNRIGVTGEVVIEDGKIKNIKNISSMNIRASREVIGCSNKIIEKIFHKEDVLNTLIVSPPRIW